MVLLASGGDSAVTVTLYAPAVVLVTFSVAMPDSPAVSVIAVLSSAATDAESMLVTVSANVSGTFPVFVIVSLYVALTPSLVVAFEGWEMVTPWVMAFAVRTVMLALAPVTLSLVAETSNT